MAEKVLGSSNPFDIASPSTRPQGVGIQNGKNIFLLALRWGDHINVCSGFD